MAFSVGGGAGGSTSGSGSTTRNIQTPSTSNVATGTGGGFFFIRPQGDYAYAPNASDNTISQYSVNPTTGALTPLAPATVVCNQTAGNTGTTKMSPNGNFLMCMDVTGGIIRPYSVGAGGQLTALATISLGVTISAFMFSPDGLFFYVLSPTAGTVYQFSFNSTTGLATPLAPASVALQAGEGVPGSYLMLNSSGQFVYAVGGASQWINRWARNTTTGLLTAAVGVDKGVGVSSRTTEGAGIVGDYLYLGDSSVNGKGVRYYTIDTSTGALTLQGVFASTDLVQHVAANSDGSMFFSTRANAYVKQYLPGTLGAPTLLTTVMDAAWNAAGGAYSTQLASNNFVYTLDIANNRIYVFSTLSSSSAALQPDLRTTGPGYLYQPTLGSTLVSKFVALGDLIAGTLQTTLALGTQAITRVGSLGGFGKYVSGSGVPLQSMFATTGAISTSLNINSATGSGPLSVAVDARNRAVYVGNYGGNTISQYTLLPSGRLQAMASPTIATGTAPSSLVADPYGRFLYALNFVSSTNSTISQYSVDSAGALTSIGAAIATGGSAPNIATAPGHGLAMHPLGKFLYASNSTEGTIAKFNVNQTTGVLSSISAPTAAGAIPVGMAVSPDGRFLYVANRTGNTVSQYSINQTTGELTSIAAAIVAGNAPIGVIVDPTSNFVYVLSFITLSQYSIDQTTGALTSLAADLSLGLQCGYFTLDITGRYIYLAERGTPGLRTLEVIADGTLSILSTSAVGIGGRTPDVIVCDFSGRYMFVVVGTSSNLVYTFSPAPLLGRNLSRLPDLGATGGTSQVLQQVTAGANITVGALTIANIGGGTGGSAYTFTAANTHSGANTFGTAVQSFTGMINFTGTTGLGGNASGITKAYIALANSSTTTIMGAIRTGWLHVTDNSGQYCRLRVMGTNPPVIESGSANFVVAASATALQYAWNINGANLQLILGSSAAASLSFLWVGGP